MNFSAEQLERYSRQLNLEEIGLSGQEQLATGRVLIIGAGGLGSPAAMYLAAAGVGTIGIADADSVEISNLQRQIIHCCSGKGAPKVESAKKTLAGLNPDVNVICYPVRVDSSNIIKIIEEKNYDFIIDATDNFDSKFLINDICVQLKKPFVHGEVLEFQGQLMTYLPSIDKDQNQCQSKCQGKCPCYRCVFGGPPAAAPGKSGVLGVVPGIIGTLQAAEAIKFLLGMDDLLSGFILSYNAKKTEFRKVKIERNINCGVCGEKTEKLHL